jgi:hypothetical protein
MMRWSKWSAGGSRAGALSGERDPAKLCEIALDRGGATAA